MNRPIIHLPANWVLPVARPFSIRTPRANAPRKTNFIMILAACCLCHAGFAATAIPEALQARIKAKQGWTEAQLNQFLPYIYPLVRDPVGGGLVLTVPDELGNQELAQLGFVDVTAPPFLADPLGKKDSTQAIQQAVNFARDHQMAVFFPPGTYAISDSIECVQNLRVRASGSIGSPPHHACVLIGSAKDPAHRAVLYLKPHSPGFTDETRKKIAIHILKRSSDKGFGNFDSGESFNQTFHNIDIRIGEGNCGAIAIRMQAAEGSSIQDCTIYNEHGHTGMRGAAGSGGSHHNLTIIGGKIGIDSRGWPPEFPEDATGTQPTPVMAHVTLIGQTEAALVHKSRGPLIGVGWRIQSKTSGPLIVNRKNHERAPFDSSLCLVDSLIQFEQPSPGNSVLTAERSFYFQNVYVSNAARLTPERLLEPAAGKWLRLEHYACAVNPSPHEGYQFSEYPSIRGERMPAFIQTAQAAPPADLRSRHIWPATAPTWEAPGGVNVKRPPYNAAGDGMTDDSAALQKAIDENEIVFLPKGYYRLTDTLRLKPNTKLIGVAHHLSILMARSPFGSLRDVEHPKPLVETSNSARADTYLAFVGIGVPYHAPSQTPGKTAGMYALRWKCAGTSILRSPGIHRLHIFGQGSSLPEGQKMLTFDHPLCLITGSGGGKWFNFFIHGSAHPETQDYRHIKLAGNTEPIRFYMLHAQHANNADSQCEAVGVKDLTVFGIKTENNTSFFRISDCDTVRLFGHGGIATPPPGGAQYTFRDVKNLLIACTADQVNLEPSKAIKDGNIKRTNINDYFPYVIVNGTQTQQMPSLERPILFIRGDFSVEPTRTNSLQVAAVLKDEAALAGAHDIEIRDGLAYVAGKGFTSRALPDSGVYPYEKGKGGSLAIVDVRQPTAPKLLWSITTPLAYEDAETVLPLGQDRLLVGTRDLFLFDVSDPANPKQLAAIDDRPRVDIINGFARLGDAVFAANKQGYIFAVDVSAPDTVRLLGARSAKQLDGLEKPHDAAFCSDLLVIVSPEGFGAEGKPGKMGVYRVVDAETGRVLPPEQWTLFGKLEHPRLAGANRVMTRGNFAYVGSSLSENISRKDDLRSNVSVIDLSDPAAPRLRGSVDFPDEHGPNGLELAGMMIFAAGGQTVQAIDVANPETPCELGRMTAPAAFPGNRDDAHDLVYHNGYLFITAQNSHSLVVVRVADERIRAAARP